VTVGSARTDSAYFKHMFLSFLNQNPTFKYVSSDFDPMIVVVVNA